MTREDEGEGEDEDRGKLLAYLAGLGASDADIAEASAANALGALALDLALRPPGGMVEFDDALVQAGIDVDDARRLWRALGFPDPLVAPPRLAPDEVEALRLISVAARELLGPDATLGVARVMGTATSRLAEALIDSFRTQFEMPQRAAGAAYSDVVEQYGAVARELLPPFLAAMGSVFRRHLVDVAAGGWTFDAEGSTARRDLVVGFADLVGYTALSRTLSSGSLARLVGRFEEIVSEGLAEYGGRLVKLIGDGAMFVVDDAGQACAIALDLVAQADGTEDVPPLRVGLAAGGVVAMSGDYYGEVVNLAARLLALAEPSTVVVDEAVRGRVAEGFAFAPVAPTAVKGFDVAPQAYRVTR